MHEADLNHSNNRLQEKLKRIFQLRRTGSKVNWDSDNYNSLLQHFGNSHNNLPPVIHVAGTNGKGSIIAMLRSILEAAGYRVHCYTSPHLVQVNERITLAGSPIKDDYLEELIDEALGFVKDAPLSFFEIITAVAFKAFSKVPADVLLLEVGMGGRFDCTNVIEKPLVSVINRISLDHTEFLGSDVTAIAAEKAGIIKQGVPCILGYQGGGEQGEAVINIVQQSAKNNVSSVIRYGEEFSVKQKNADIEFTYKEEAAIYPVPNLTGFHQILNAAVVMATLRIIEDSFDISASHIAKGLQNIVWPGRLQRVDQEWPRDIGKCEVWLDSGHNDSAAEVLAQQMIRWKQNDSRAIYLIIGMLGNKDSSAFISPLLPHVKDIHIVPIASDFSSQIAIDTIKLDFEPIEHGSFDMAVQAITDKDNRARIVIAGSVYLCGEVLQFIG